MAVTRLKGRGDWGGGRLEFIDYKVSIWKNKEVTEIVDADNCTR